MKSLGRRARGFKRHKPHKLHKLLNRRSRSRLPNDSSCAPIGPDEVRKEKREESRLAESPTVGAETSADGGTKPPRIGVPVRTLTRSELSSKSVSAVEVEMRARRGFGPQDEGCRRGECSPRPNALRARSHGPPGFVLCKRGSKTARAGLGTIPRPATLPTGSESDVSKKRT